MNWESHLEMLNSTGRVVWSMDDFSAGDLTDGSYYFTTDSWDLPVNGFVTVKDGKFDFDQFSNEFPESYKMVCRHWYVEGFELQRHPKYPTTIVFNMGS